ncbi:2Fe-2S iron-sulfur cluster-binding protein [Paenibacillus tepidiphilus]|uniref:2Fe-2S iron-sulfur cluster-binding protein n=1 Tax=Paenibacillus tepidiphilus TaxID=2608683 RepID=UPI00123852AC|nr:2Fe-2S iron-sulfur cluster-binding protein [Paenibacillus tepidiphilus]
MQTLHKVTVTFQPEGRKVAVNYGTTVLEAARRGGITLPTRCGGKAGCLMCKVTVDEQEASSLASPGEIERRKLGSLLEKNVRLACQAAVKGAVTVTVPEDPLKAAVRRRLEAARSAEEDRLW